MFSIKIQLPLSHSPLHKIDQMAVLRIFVYSSSIFSTRRSRCWCRVVVILKYALPGCRRQENNLIFVLFSKYLYLFLNILVRKEGNLLFGKKYKILESGSDLNEFLADIAIIQNY